MAKRNWSRVETPHWTKTHRGKYPLGSPYRQSAGKVTVTVDPDRVAAAFAAKSDAEGKQFYQPPIVGKSICR